VNPARRSLRVVIDAEDSGRARGLLLVSALHVAAPRLAGVVIEVLNGDDPSVGAALENLVWEAGLRVVVHPADTPPQPVLSGAALFVAVAVADARHLPLREAAAAGVPALVPVQFPSAVDARALALVRAAHDPAELARRIVIFLGIDPR
jgi:hypothetical protein